MSVKKLIDLNKEEIDYFLKGLPEKNIILKVIEDSKVPVNTRVLHALSQMWNYAVTKGYEDGCSKNKTVKTSRKTRRITEKLESIEADLQNALFFIDMIKQDSSSDNYEVVESYWVVEICPGDYFNGFSDEKVDDWAEIDDVVRYDNYGDALKTALLLKYKDKEEYKNARPLLVEYKA